MTSALTKDQINAIVELVRQGAFRVSPTNRKRATEVIDAFAMAAKGRTYPILFGRSAMEASFLSTCAHLVYKGRMAEAYRIAATCEKRNPGCTAPLNLTIPPGTEPMTVQEISVLARSVQDQCLIMAGSADPHYRASLEAVKDLPFPSEEVAAKMKYAPHLRAIMAEVMALVGVVDIAFVVLEFPRSTRFDEARRWHNKLGPAYEWEDGYGFYFIQNTRLSKEEVMHPERLDPIKVLTTQNIEKRRALVEVIGWDKLLASLPKKCIGTDSYGTLYHVKLPTGETQAFCRVLCPTGRTFMVLVDEQDKTPLEAIARTYHVPPHVYAQLRARQ